MATKAEKPVEAEASETRSEELSIRGMNCAHCVRAVTDALQAVPGVASANVSLEDGRAKVRWRSDAAQRTQALIAAVKAAGYEAKPVSAGTKTVSKWSPLSGGWLFNVVVGSACALPLIIGEWIFGLGMTPWFHWFAFLLAFPVQILCGARFYRGAWLQLKSGGANMDTLVALGSTTAFAYSVWALFSGAGGHLYFMESAAIITLISVGHWLEGRAARQSETALRALLKLAPQIARLARPDGSETEVPVGSLRPDDTLSIKPGDRVPCDGQAIRGQSTVDESMLTGESFPVEKRPGNKLYGGTVNLNGQLLMKVTATGEATALAHIIAAVQRAQNSRADIQRLADRISNIFVPAVILIALAAGLWWGLAPEAARSVHQFLAGYLWPAHLPPTIVAAAIISAAAVLIVACPCAMGLATPAAIMAGTNVAAGRGILIRDGVALEKAGTITAVMLDKTGTVTHGRPEVVDVYAGSSSKEETLKLAAALARHSNHPLSRSVAKLSSADVPMRDWQEARGSGVQAQFIPQQDPTRKPAEAATLRLGSLKWLEQCGVDTRPGSGFSSQWMDRGATILGLAGNAGLIGLIALQDTLKPGAQAVVRRLKSKHLKVFLATGDNRRTAKAIAEQLGLAPENVHAEIRPEQKAELVRELQSRSERVAFVGDGINDAPALEQADLGIAVSRASDVANQAADIILLKTEIEAVPEAIDLAQATLRAIKQNLFWAFFYNAAAVPLAALGFLSPVLCAAAMGLSDLIVIGNALRLRRWRSGVSEERR